MGKVDGAARVRTGSRPQKALRARTRRLHDRRNPLKGVLQCLKVRLPKKPSGGRRSSSLFRHFCLIGLQDSSTLVVAHHRLPKTKRSYERYFSFTFSLPEERSLREYYSYCFLSPSEGGRMQQYELMSRRVSWSTSPFRGVLRFSRCSHRFVFVWVLRFRHMNLCKTARASAAELSSVKRRYGNRYDAFANSAVAGKSRGHLSKLVLVGRAHQEFSFHP